MVSKLLSIISFILLIIFSCETGDKKSAKERLLQGEFSAYDSFPSIHCDSLELDSTDNVYNYQDSSFTGVCFTTYPNSNNRLEERQIYNGKLHGNRIMFSPKGDTLNLNLYKNGKLLRESIGEREVCHCDSLEIRTLNDQEVRYYFDEPYTGKCEKFYTEDTTAIYIEASYRNGVPHGEMNVYSREGEKILQEKYVDGEKVNY